MSKPLTKPKSLKAQMTRTNLVLAAAALLREAGPDAVTYRRVAEWAGASSSSVGYYFTSVTELLHEAGRYNIDLWVERAEKVADEAEALEPQVCAKRAVGLICRACLPNDTVSLPAHYAQLIAASESTAVTDAYRQGRKRLDEAIGRILDRAGIALTPGMVSALVDGAAVKAVSEGYGVVEVATPLLEDAIRLASAARA